MKKRNLKKKIWNEKNFEKDLSGNEIWKKIDLGEDFLKKKIWKKNWCKTSVNNEKIAKL